MMGTGQWAVTTTCEAVLTWNYDVVHQGLRDLYERAKREQWNVTVDVDWSPPVDPDDELLLDHENPHIALIQDSAIWRKMTPQERSSLRYETLAWNLSQFLHGEQLDSSRQPSPGSMPNCTAAPRWSTRRGTPRCFRAICGRRSARNTRSPTPPRASSTPFSRNPAGILSTWGCKWSLKDWPWGSSPACIRRRKSRFSGAS